MVKLRAGLNRGTASENMAGRKGECNHRLRLAIAPRTGMALIAMGFHDHAGRASCRAAGLGYPVTAVAVQRSAACWFQAQDRSSSRCLQLAHRWLRGLNNKILTPCT